MSSSSSSTFEKQHKSSSSSSSSNSNSTSSVNMTWKQLTCLLSLSTVGGFFIGHLFSNRHQFFNKYSSSSSYCHHHHHHDTTNNFNDKQQVLIIGDSTTWGYCPDTQKRLPYEKRYTSVLKKKLNEQSKNKKKKNKDEEKNTSNNNVDDDDNDDDNDDDEIEIAIEALNGRTIGQADRELSKHPYNHSTLECIHILLHSHKPLDVVVIMLGINDCKGKFKYTLEGLKEHMLQLIDIIIQSDIWKSQPKIILISPAPMEKVTSQNSQWDFNEQSMKLSQQLPIIYSQIANQDRPNIVTFVNANQEWSVHTGSDSIHLDAQANQRLGEGLAITLRQVLEDQKKQKQKQNQTK